MEFNHWPSIESFHRVVKDNKFALEDTEFGLKGMDRVVYRPKVKLHGSNAAITIEPNGNVYAQSRSRIITPGPGDNCGFAAWVAEHEGIWTKNANQKTSLTIYGEWCGRGVQKGVAISNIDTKVFAIFAMQADWEIIQFDKTTGKELNRFDDYQEYLDKNRKLKVLSGTYGQAVRKAYADLEKANKLDEYVGMVVFTKTTVDCYGDPDLINKDDVDEVLESIDATFTDKKDYKWVKQGNSIAVVFKDPSDAVLLKLSFAGELTVNAVDISKLTELV